MSDTIQHEPGPARRAAAAAALRAAEREDKDRCLNAERKPEADPKARPDWVQACMDEACAPLRECGQAPPTRSHSPEPAVLCHGRTTHSPEHGRTTHYIVPYGIVRPSRPWHDDPEPTDDVPTMIRALLPLNDDDQMTMTSTTRAP